MPIISEYAQRKKIEFFIDPIPKDAHVLEIGSGSNWLGKYMKANGWKNYVGMDIVPPAEIVGDINEWQKLGIKPGSMDYIVAFEVLEHVDCLESCWNILKDDGKLLVTTPMPHTDWILKILESLGLNQKRTSPHSNLIYLHKIKYFKPVELKTKMQLTQWAVLKKV
jgi:SAM-dependent methyltransferase